MPDPVQTFMTDIGKVETMLMSNISRITTGLSKLSEIEIIKVLEELDIYQMALDLGYADAVNKLMDSYNLALGAVTAEAIARGVNPAKGAIASQLQLLKDYDTARLLGQAKIFAESLRTELARGLFEGKTVANIIADLSKITGLDAHKLRVGVADGVRQFQQYARMKVFAGENVRWTYIGPLDDKTRPICEQAITSEPTGGYTEAERDALPAGGSEGGGWNCRHEWGIV